MPTDLNQQFTVFNGEPVHIYVQTMLSRYPAIAANSEFKHHLSQAVDQMVLQIVSWCAAGRIPTEEHTETVSWPDGVWQMFKSRYAPHWFVTRFPVRLASKTVASMTNHYFVCPHVDVPAHGSSLRWHLAFMATGTPLAERIMTNANLP